MAQAQATAPSRSPIGSDLPSGSNRSAGESGAAATTADHDTQRRQGADGHAVVPGCGGAEGALGRGLRAAAIGGCGDGRVRSDVDVEREFGCELVGARLQVASADELTVAEQRPALVFAGRIAGIYGIGLAALIVVRLTTEDAISVYLFEAFIVDHTQTLRFAVRGLVARAAAVTLGVAVVIAVLLALAVIALEAIVGNGTRGAAVGTVTDADFVRALAADGFALLRAGVGMSLLAASGIRCGAALATHAVRLLCANLLHGGGRAGRLAFLDWLEFAMRISAQEHAATLVERFGVGSIGQEQDG